MKRLFALLPKLIILFSVLVLLLYNGILKYGEYAVSRYPVRGVDVSSYQGEINWDILSRHGIQFAFVKATEGSAHADSRFDANFAGARAAGLRVGAYHFFSYDSTGEAQAENFIARVPKAKGMLPPVVDVEFYGDNDKNPPPREATDRILTALLNRLEEHYGMKPIIYATGKSYRLYISGAYAEYDIWICDIMKSPSLPDRRRWTFWQYSHTGRLSGYTGDEEHIDLNVFYGTKSDFALYAQ